MVQGTTSDAGKSTMVAGLCRLLKRRGIRVAPFKPQNMALNSAVTSEGGEIGRAQALQAQAAGVDPSVHMNPILIKPSSDTQAQIIVQGKARVDLDAAEYQDFKKDAMKWVMQSSSQLAQDYEVIVVEGAGSPAEINLRENDVANMGFAEKVDCPVILVADIDRGGVFAHIVGTLDLLAKSERDRIVGFIINRFRGDISLLQSGLDWLQEKTKNPVIGVVPYIKALYLDEEDAIRSQQKVSETSLALKVLVPVLPHISNHTDFDVLRLHPQVNLVFCSLDQPQSADLIILPGSKNVRQDLFELKRHGWQNLIQKHLRYGGKLLGICGGYQMLGKRVSDPYGIEGEKGESDALGLLDCVSQLHQEKTLSNIQACLLFDEETIQTTCYEIHCGETQSNEQPFARLADQRIDGAISSDKQIMGTYLHGIFDQPEVANKLLAWAGLINHDAEKEIQVSKYQQQEIELDRLANVLEQHLDLNQLFSSLGCQEKL